MNAQDGTGGRRWSLTLLFLAGTLNLFDRQIINVLGQQIKTELQISDGELGLLTGTAFGLLYSIAIIPLARLADRTNRVWVVASALTVWSAFTGFCGLAGNFIQLFLARMGVGVGEAGGQPASVSLVGDLFPREQRASATAVLLVGAPAGACLGLLLGGYMGTNWGWRMALFAASVPGLVLAVLMLLTMKDPTAIGERKHEAGTLQAALRLLASRRSLLWLTAAFACQTFCLHATAAWLPLFFIRTHEITEFAAGTYLGLAVGVGGAAGAIGIGFLCDAFRRSGRPRDWLLTKIVMVMNLPLIAFTVLSPYLSIAVFAMLLLSAVVYGYLGPVPVLIQQLATPGTKALSIGGVTAVANIMSMCIGVPAVGLLSDILRPHFGAPAVGYALAVFVGAAAILGFLALGAAQRAAEENTGTALPKMNEKTS